MKKLGWSEDVHEEIMEQIARELGQDPEDHDIKLDQNPWIMLQLQHDEHGNEVWTRTDNHPGENWIVMNRKGNAENADVTARYVEILAERSIDLEEFLVDFTTRDDLAESFRKVANKAK